MRNFVISDFFNNTPRERSSEGVYRNHPLCPSVCWFDFGLPYLAHGSTTMRGCVKYIHDPDTTLTFDLKVKFIGFMTWLCVQASAFLSFDIVILCLARKCITMVRCVHTFMNSAWPWSLTSISKLYFHHGFKSYKMTLPFDLGILNFGMWVYHRNTTCCVHSWLWYDFDLWPICGWRGVFLVSFSHSFYLVACDMAN